MEIFLQLLDDVDDAVITLAYSHRVRIRLFNLALVALLAGAVAVFLLWA